MRQVDIPYFVLFIAQGIVFFSAVEVFHLMVAPSGNYPFFAFSIALVLIQHFGISIVSLQELVFWIRISIHSFLPKTLRCG